MADCVVVAHVAVAAVTAAVDVAGAVVVVVENAFCW